MFLVSFVAEECMPKGESYCRSARVHKVQKVQHVQKVDKTYEAHEVPLRTAAPADPGTRAPVQLIIRSGGLRSDRVETL